MSTDENKQEATLHVDGHELKFPIIEGSEGERAIDIAGLRKQTGLVSLDPGFVNTASCESSITFLNGEEGILRHRGYSIEDLAGDASFLGVAYLLVYGELPTNKQLADFESRVQAQYDINPEIEKILHAYPQQHHPMAVLSSCTIALTALYPDDMAFETGETVPILLAKFAVVTAAAHRLGEGKEIIPPDPKLGYCENFLHMVFGDEDIKEDVMELMASVLNRMLILHADHEQNCSTSTVRLVYSSDANPYAAIAAGVGALWGPLHGGANQKVMEMLQAIKEDGGDIEKTLEKARNKEIRLMGFGHRVYKTYDPRARIAKMSCDEFLEKLGERENLVDIAVQLETAALADEYFSKRNLYPNVDFYTGLIYRAMKFPTDLFTALFAIGRLPGWMAHAMELKVDPAKRIGRPRQVYQGPNAREFVALADRD